MNNEPTQLMNLARQCRAAYDACVADDADLFGGSLLDLCANQIPRASLADLKAAIIVSGIYVNANERIRSQIAKY